MWNCSGLDIMSEVVALDMAADVRLGKMVGMDSLSMTGGILALRFCLNCSMTSATFSELASLETGITLISLEGGVLGAAVDVTG